MKTLTIRNIPDDLHATLKVRAKQNHRSLNQEVVAELSRVATAETDEDRRLRVETEIREIGALRARAKAFFTAAEIDQAREEGRR
jgi:plasmid stability protein